MVFIGGPRQVGKTTLALSLLGQGTEPDHPAYLNWDAPGIAASLRQGKLPSDQPLVILDEIHKYKNWRNLVKGLYDTQKTKRRFLVTGSARLDYYRKGGDSLVNRYRYFRLHPFSLREYDPAGSEKSLQNLLQFGGFPEPLFSKDPKELRIWQRDRLSRVIRDDLRDLENVKEVSLLEALVELLPSKVGSPLSIQGLREDLEVDHKTVSRWIGILENLYVCFRIAPYGSPKIRAVKKEQKLYLWDWSVIGDEGIRFENLVAAQLLKYCHLLEDTEGFRMELRYIRDTDKREVDFVVLQDSKPLFAVEVKLSDTKLAPALRYFAERTLIPHFFQVHTGVADYEQHGIRVLPFSRFCEIWQMP
jgi:predicted AAA+ superfamily ATPase